MSHDGDDLRGLALDLIKEESRALYPVPEVGREPWYRAMTPAAWASIGLLLVSAFYLIAGFAAGDLLALVGMALTCAVLDLGARR